MKYFHTVCLRNSLPKIIANILNDNNIQKNVKLALQAKNLDVAD